MWNEDRSFDRVLNVFYCQCVLMCYRWPHSWLALYRPDRRLRTRGTWSRRRGTCRGPERCHLVPDAALGKKLNTGLGTYRIRAEPRVVRPHEQRCDYSVAEGDEESDLKSYDCANESKSGARIEVGWEQLKSSANFHGQPDALVRRRWLEPTSLSDKVEDHSLSTSDSPDQWSPSMITLNYRTHQKAARTVSWARVWRKPWWCRPAAHCRGLEW